MNLLQFCVEKSHINYPFFISLGNFFISRRKFAKVEIKESIFFSQCFLLIIMTKSSYYLLKIYEFSNFFILVKNTILNIFAKLS